MLQEQRHIYYDSDLKIEAYNLSGIVQKFPNHFHEYYVIGFIQGGMRHLYGLHLSSTKRFLQIHQNKYTKKELFK